MKKHIYISIGMLSASIIAFQLTLMQILSISQWNHFAYMVISVALLGFGASGTVLTFTKKKLVAHIDFVLPLLFIATSLCMAATMFFGDFVFGGFDSYLLFIDRGHIWGLAGSYMALFIPFFFGALAIGLIYTTYVENIGKLYFADLAGSGVGGLFMLLLLWMFTPGLLPFAVAFFPLIGALLLLNGVRKSFLLVLITISVLIIVSGFILRPQIPMSQYKSLSRSMLLPSAEIVSESPSAYGLNTHIKAPALRYAPGLSLTYMAEIPVREALFNNGNWFGPLVDFSANDKEFFMNYTSSALPYIVADPVSVLIPDAGTGLYAAQALANNALQITAVEPNKAATRHISDSIKNANTGIRFINMHSRSYLLSDKNLYDLIVLPVLESFGGSSGINALSEQYLFTIDAFANMWDRLTPNGMIAATVWMDYPARNSLKMLATLVETAELQGIADVSQHIVAVRSWGTITYVIKKTGFTEIEIAKILDFCDKMNFDPFLFPGIKSTQRARYNMLQDESLFALSDEIMTANRHELYSSYDFQIRPATDKKPYFSQFLKISRLSRLNEIFGQTSMPFLEIGYLLVLLTFFQITLLAILLIIAPLFILGFKGKGRSYTLLHFSGIGMGFMFVEIILIQQFILYFGHPIYAAAAVLSGMLLFTGAGSYFSKRLVPNTKILSRYLIGVVFFILLLALILTPIIKLSISQHIFVKILICIVITGPLAFLMGLPFPVGLKHLSVVNNKLVPWAWGINGCFSVISTALATIIAVEAGFVAVMITGAATYFIAAMANRN